MRHVTSSDNLIRIDFFKVVNYQMSNAFEYLWFLENVKMIYFHIGKGQ